MQVVTIIGARPQFVKHSALTRALKACDKVVETVIHTGQHHDPEMSDAFFHDLEIPEPAINLGVAGGSHGDMTGRMLGRIEDVLKTIAPDLVVVYGDTNSTLAGALAAAKMNIPVAHVEAGLRSFNRKMPEEINRVLVDHVSAFLFVPTHQAVANLAAEGITRGVYCVGDVMYDVTLRFRDRARKHAKAPQHYGLTPGHYFVATVHRQENTETAEALDRVITYLDRIAEELPVVLPLHPRTRHAADRLGLSWRNITVLPPLGYFDMLRLVDEAAAVYTDSGGLQKEAYFLRKPCITLRDQTEWTETVASGWNRLWTAPDYQAPRALIEDYGNGNAARVIADVLIRGLPE